MCKTNVPLMLVTVEIACFVDVGEYSKYQILDSRVISSSKSVILKLMREKLKFFLNLTLMLYMWMYVKL